MSPSPKLWRVFGTWEICTVRSC